MKSKKAKNECSYFHDFLFVLGRLFINLCVLVIVLKLFKTKACNARDAIHSGRSE